MYYIGIDVHQRTSSVEILDAHGALYNRFTVRGPRDQLVAWMEAEAPRPHVVAFEASCGYGYLHDALSRRAVRVEVGHPGHLRLIFRYKKKTNRIDATKLAKLLFLGEIPQVYVPIPEVRAARGLGRPDALGRGQVRFYSTDTSNGALSFKTLLK